jgi:hypothetical protein
MYSTFLTASPGSVLFSRSNLLKRKDLCFSCLRLGLVGHRRSLRSSHLFSSGLTRFRRVTTRIKLFNFFELSRDKMSPKVKGDGGSTVEKRPGESLPDTVRARKNSSTPIASETTTGDRLCETEKKTKDNTTRTQKHTVLSMVGLTSAVWTLGMFQMVAVESCQCIRRTKQTNSCEVGVRHVVCTVPKCGIVVRYQNTSNMDQYYIRGGTDHKELVDRLTTMQQLERQDNLGSGEDGHMVLSRTFNTFKNCAALTIPYILLQSCRVQKGKELNDFQRIPLDIEILSNLRFGSLEIRDTSVTRVTNKNTLLMQDTQYPTCNLVIPQLYQMITKLEMSIITYVMLHVKCGSRISKVLRLKKMTLKKMTLK